MPGFDINTVSISGNLTRDPELRSTTSGTSVANLRIAANNRRKDASGNWIDEPMFFDITVWAGMGEYVAKNLKKGEKVVIAGRLMWREFDDKDGNKRQAVSITADSVVPVPRNGNGSSAQAEPAKPAEEPAPF